MPTDRSTRLPIRVVAERTGLEPYLIRTWEKRYGAITPQRTVGRHRTFDENDVERLILLRRVVESGHRISRVAHLDDGALRRRLEQTEDPPLSDPGSTGIAPVTRATTTQTTVSVPNPRPGVTAPIPPSPIVQPTPLLDEPSHHEPSLPGIEACLSAARRLDAPALNSALERDLVEVGPQRVLARLVEPLIQRLRGAVRRGDLRPMHAQMAEVVLRSFVDSLMRRRRIPEVAPPLVVVTLPGAGLDLTAHLASAAAVHAGWQVVLLGSGLAVEEVAAAARQVEARALALVLDRAEPHLGEELLRLRRLLTAPVTILAQGPAVHAYQEYLRAAEMIAIDSSEHLGRLLTELSSSPATRPMAWAPRRADERFDAASPAPAPSLEGLARPSRSTARRELPLCRQARERLPLDDQLIGPGGGLRIDDLHRLRLALLSLNEHRPPEIALRTGRLAALGLLDSFAGRQIDAYRRSQRRRSGQDVMELAAQALQERHGQERLSAVFRALDLAFPRPHAGAEPNAERLQRLWRIWLLATNPAASVERDLFDSGELDRVGYGPIVQSLEGFFRRRPAVELDGNYLFELVRRPIRRGRESLERQLEALRDAVQRLEQERVDAVLVGLDLLHEESGDLKGQPLSPPPPVEALDFADVARSDFAFREEPAWMREAVVIAKHVHVWLGQLSELHGRRIRRLDEIPDATLDLLRSRGFNVLWMIGMWRRSPASRRIKHLTGHAQAISSAYAVDCYAVADDLGGETALESLRSRCAERGLRLACDVVPNHMGLDSEQLSTRPEDFLSLERCPFPDYSFDGPDLSPEDPTMTVHLEDGYYDQSRAAIVFRRTDRESGEVRYIYHGNDGSGLPWNDTAQLDYLSPDVQERFLDQLVALARRFSVIRLDAAMALVKQHIQRLWHPRPGQGGAVPSRAQHGVDAETFDLRLPEELWRLAVERLDQEAPETLLLAEGFWLMETYFLSTLGMHRVYHSAFSHMLREERNEPFRRSLENILAFEPRLLERFVCFLTSPDEPSAAAQLGKGDKYFALCIMLATLPGVPLFGHGQVDGLLEQYGMDYRHAHYLEAPDPAFVARHEREIAPLLQHRRLFGNAKAFELVDVHLRDDGPVCQDVFAFAIHDPDSAGSLDRALILVHNRRAVVRGTLRLTAPRRTHDDDRPQRRNLAQALGLDPSRAEHWTLIDTAKEKSLTVSCHELENGLPLELGPYEAKVFTEFVAEDVP